MFKIFKIARVTFFSLLLAFSLLSCKSNSKEYKQDLADSIYYCEAPSDSNLGDLKRGLYTFNKLEPKDKRNLTRLLKNPDNILWLKIEFSLRPDNTRTSIGMYMGHLRSASLLFLNDNPIRKYGELPPMENSSGFMAHFYMFPLGILKEGTNTIYIKVWPGPYGSISENCFIGEQSRIFLKAEKVSFFNSQIVITFMFVSLMISLIYLILYFILKKYKENRTYLCYALLNLYTAHFLLLFCFAELPFLKIPNFSYLLILKLTLCYGGFSTIYFANSFIISYLGYDVSYREMNLRLAMHIVTLIISFLIPSYSLFAKLIPFVILLSLSQFSFSIPRIFSCLLKKEKRQTVIRMLHGFSSVLIVLPVDVILKAFLHKSDFPFLTLYSWQVTIYFFLWQLLHEFGHMYVHNTKLTVQLEDFNSSLEEVVSLRTKELSEANYILSKGLETVSHVQNNFLPRKEKTFKGWDLSIFYKPLDNNVSGDLYDYYTTNNTLDGLGIFDVSGHGIPAGLMTILAKGIISQQFISGVAQNESISEILEEINRTYIREKVNVENYITGLLFRFSDFNKNDVCSVEFANAGHPYPIFYSAEKDTVTELKFENPDMQYGIIGVEGLDVSFPPVSLRMNKNDIILCFTDGITEATNNDKIEFSKDRLMTLLQQNKDLTASEITSKIIEELNVFTDNKPISDDITLIVLKRNDSNDYIEEI